MTTRIELHWVQRGHTNHDPTGRSLHRLSAVWDVCEDYEIEEVVAEAQFYVDRSIKHDNWVGAVIHHYELKSK
jgi:hypothetical protein